MQNGRWKRLSHKFWHGKHLNHMTDQLFLLFRYFYNTLKHVSWLLHRSAATFSNEHVKLTQMSDFHPVFYSLRLDWRSFNGALFFCGGLKVFWLENWRPLLLISMKLLINVSGWKQAFIRTSFCQFSQTLWVKCATDLGSAAPDMFSSFRCGVVVPVWPLRVRYAVTVCL